jgi:hypothetical protein
VLTSLSCVLSPDRQLIRSLSFLQRTWFLFPDLSLAQSYVNRKVDFRNWGWRFYGKRGRLGSWASQQLMK